MPIRFVVCLIAVLLPTKVPAASDAGVPYASDGGAPLLELGEESEADDDAAEDEDGVPDEGESEASQLVEIATDGGLLYSADLPDEELERRWTSNVESLGTISVGFAEAGRLINGVSLGPADSLTVVAPEAAWGTRELIDAVATAARAVREKFPDAPPLRVNHIAKREGGYLRPHVSHQSGRDVDLGFFYKSGLLPGGVRGAREKLIEAAQNWALIRALVTSADVQVILVDRRVQKVLYEYALASGEDKAWLDEIFHAGRDSLVRHARRHRDHFHVRLFAARSQELGRRVQPLLAKRPEENVVIYRIRKGDTLGHVATRYGSTVRLIQKANRMSSTRLSIGRTLNVPLRGPCTQCPMPPAVRVPPRRLPPDAPAVAAMGSDAGTAGAPDAGTSSVELAAVRPLGAADAGSRTPAQ